MKVSKEMRGGSYAIHGLVSMLSFGETSIERACVHATLHTRYSHAFNFQGP